MAAKMGSIELLYVTELIGLIVIWGGYSFCVSTASPREKIPLVGDADG